MSNGPNVTILGGGPAGLAIGYYARQAGLKFTIFEAQNRIGGNCVTLQHGEFRFDSGAHRFHDKIPEVTCTIQQLVGPDLRKIEVPSQIWHRGRFFDFPIAPFNLLKTLGPWDFARATASLVRGRLGWKSPDGSFRDFVVHTYGADVAARFLLNYSEKLWGAPCDRLSPAICGARLKGLGLKSLVIEALFGRRANTRHLDGAFYYPRRGYGTIVERLADACGHDNIRCESPVTRICHTGEHIRSIEVNGRTRIPIDELACTLPLGLTLRLLDPQPPAALLDGASALRYRNVVLVAVFIAKDRITNNGSVYFPDPTVPFTRVYEPKNRSDELAPRGHTSLVAEIPCQPGDAVWNADRQSLVEMVSDHFVRIGWLSRSDVVGATTHRLHHAYPILELDYDTRLAPIAEYLGRFRNLQLAGRNGCFVYSHLHDMLRHGSDVIDGYRQPRPRVARPGERPAKGVERRAA